MDRRIKYTKRVIKDTIIKLLQEKDIKKITVSEICKIADINRATFYRYYLDVYDLLDQIKEDLITELRSAINDSSEYTVAIFAKDLLQVLYDNRELVKVLSKTENNVYFFDDFLEIAYEKCKASWEKDLKHIDEEKIEYASLFIFNGALGLVNYWVNNDFDKDIDELAKIIEKLSYFGIKRFIYRQ